MKWSLTGLLLAAVMLTACGGPAAAVEPTPPTIYYGEDICEACGMIISDARFAAAYITREGEGHTFDEIGGMVNAYLEQPDDVVALFVHDYDDQRWIRAETATYVLSDAILTPMAFGLIAFASVEQARAFASDLEAEVWTFDEMIDHYQQRAADRTRTHSR